MPVPQGFLAFQLDVFVKGGFRISSSEARCASRIFADLDYLSAMLALGDDASEGSRMVGHGQKIKLGEMRASGVRGVLVICSDFKCGHWQRLSAVDCARWTDDVRLSDIEPQFVCKACGQRGAEVRPDYQTRTKPDGIR